MPTDLDLDASAHTEVIEYQLVPVAGARYKGNTHNTPEYVNTMDLDV